MGKQAIHSTGKTANDAGVGKASKPVQLCQLLKQNYKQTVSTPDYVFDPAKTFLFEFWVERAKLGTAVGFKLLPVTSCSGDTKSPSDRQGVTRKSNEIFSHQQGHKYDPSYLSCSKIF